MPRGIKKAESGETAAAWELGAVLGNYKTLKQAWLAVSRDERSQDTTYEPNVVRIGNQWYIAVLVWKGEE